MLSRFLRPARFAVAATTAITAAFVFAACGDSSTEPAGPKRFETVAVFGASLDDTGNACNAAPTSCPPPPYATGRFSNGPLYVEVMAERLNARIVPSRTGGLNFAFAGARTGPISGTTQATPNMVQQADLYLQNAPTAGRDLTLHVVNAATVGNDINDALVQARTNPNAPATIIAGAVQNITSIVTRLHGGGARHVLLLNSTDIGRTPQVSALGAATAGLATQLSNQFNTALNAALPSLRAATPGLTIYVVDLGALTAQVVANPQQFGFTNITAACVVASPPSLCTTPDSFFYWDAFHPTAAAGRLVAQRALTAIGR